MPCPTVDQEPRHYLAEPAAASGDDIKSIRRDRRFSRSRREPIEARHARHAIGQAYLLLVAWQAEGGVVMIGRGIAGRWEVAVEVDPEHRGRGLGRTLAIAARHLVPAEAVVWAQIAPGNAASVRAFLAAGFQPVGAEALLVSS